MRQPRFIVAVACGVTSYALMNLLMTSAPLAMVGCGHSVTDATLGIQWHVLAMYGPSFITGSLVARFGVMRITGIGMALLALTGVVGITGLSVAHFWGALVLLGLGWNLRFIGATTMVTGCHRPRGAHQGAVVQRLSDLRQHGGGLILVRAIARRVRLGGDQRCDFPDRASRRRFADLARLRDRAERSSGLSRPAGSVKSSNTGDLGIASAQSFWLYPRAFPVGVKRPQSGHPRRPWRRAGALSSASPNLIEVESTMTTLWMIVGCGVLAIVYGIWAITSVLSADAGSERMQEISAAVREGAQAYLKRQYATIGGVGVVIFLLIGFTLGWLVAIGFAVGAILSGATGFIGMNVSVRANVRTAQAATKSLAGGLELAFKSGAITGMLVAGLALLGVTLYFGYPHRYAAIWRSTTAP